MSQVEDDVEDVITAEPVDAGAGLSARMQGRAHELEKQRSELFPIPGWEDLLEVELTALGYTVVRRIIERHEKIRDTSRRELYTLADQLITATQGFYEVRGEERVKINDTWITLARRIDPDTEFTQRQALLKLVGDSRVHFLMQDWATWARSVRSEIDEEVVRDFDTTG